MRFIIYQAYYRLLNVSSQHTGKEKVTLKVIVAVSVALYMDASEVWQCRTIRMNVGTLTMRVWSEWKLQLMSSDSWVVCSTVWPSSLSGWSCQSIRLEQNMELSLSESMQLMSSFNIVAVYLRYFMSLFVFVIIHGIEPLYMLCVLHTRLYFDPEDTLEFL